MSASDFEKAVELIETNPDLDDFIGPRSEHLVVKAEEALQLKYPPLYRQFVRKYGCGGFGPSEIYGVLDDNLMKATVPNGVWLTLKPRRKGYLPPHLILISFLDDGEYAALDTRYSYEPDQCPVIICAPGIYELSNNPEVLADDFGRYFLDKVVHALKFNKRI
jgi:antitoxin YobK